MIEQKAKQDHAHRHAEGGWQDRTIYRLQKLSLGFRFGPGIRWFPVDDRGHPVAGPFHTPEAFDVWLEDKEKGLA
jgi:hypothetical protein